MANEAPWTRCSRRSGAQFPTRTMVSRGACRRALTRVPEEPPLSFELRREDETRTAELLREGLVMAAVLLMRARNDRAAR